jgi:hypothetical protein
MEKQYCIYIMTNQEHNVLYTGVTNNLKRRVLEHTKNRGSEFTKKYKVHKLVVSHAEMDGHSFFSESCSARDIVFHGSAKPLNSISTIFSQLPCLGV